MASVTVSSVGYSLDGNLLTVLGSTEGMQARARTSSDSTLCGVPAFGCASGLVKDPFEWRTDVSDIVAIQPYGTSLYENGAVYLTALAEGRVEVTASMNGVEGRAVWNVVERARVDWSLPTLGTGGPRAGVAVGADGTAYVSAHDGLQAVGPGGAKLWVVARPAGNMPAIGADGTIYLGSDEDLVAIDSGGQVLWETHVGHIWAPPAVGPDGTIYQVTQDGTLYAVAPTGQIKWSFAAPGPLTRNWSSPAIALDGTIYFGSQDDHLYAIDPDGNQLWRFATGGDVRSPSIGVDGTIYVGNDRVAESGTNHFVVLADAKLYALSPDGEVLWNAVLDGEVWGGPAVAFDGTVYMGTDDWLYAFDAGGSELSKHPPGTLHTPIVAGDGSIYLGVRAVYALDADGTLRWEYRSKTGSFMAPAIGFDGTIYATSSDRSVNRLHGFTELTGNNGGYDSAPWPQARGDRANTGRARGGP